MAQASVMVAEAAARPTTDIWPTPYSSLLSWTSACRMSTIRAKVATWWATLTVANASQVVRRRISC